MSALVVRGDARRLPLADASVDLVVTSPPYLGLRAYSDGGQPMPGQVGAEGDRDGFLAALWQVTRELARVLKPTGSLFVNLGDSYEAKSLQQVPARYSIGCTDRLGLLLRAEIVWDKNGLPEKVTDRVRRGHEVFFHFTKQQSYWADVTPLRTPKASSWTRGNERAYERRALVPGSRAHKGLSSSTGHPDGSLPGSVWRVPTEPLRDLPPDLAGVEHNAAFPLTWPLRLVAAFCPPGGLVLDPFGGTGTTALAASVLCRRAVSVDLSADYCRLAAWRTTDRAERAKASGSTLTDPKQARVDTAELF